MKIRNLYLVKNTNGGILGGYRTRVSAEICRKRWQERYDASRYVRGVEVYVQKVRTIG